VLHLRIDCRHYVVGGVIWKRKVTRSGWFQLPDWIRWICGCEWRAFS